MAGFKDAGPHGDRSHHLVCLEVLPCLTIGQLHVGTEPVAGDANLDKAVGDFELWPMALIVDAVDHHLHTVRGASEHTKGTAEGASCYRTSGQLGSVDAEVTLPGLMHS